MRIYNTETRKKEDFIPIQDGHVKMYVCGPTVYDFLHIGNYRGAIFFNCVRNWLERRGFLVKYVYNYTDVDDRILNRAKEENVEPKEIAEKYILEFQKDYKSLLLRPHTHNPKVTDYIPKIVDFISKLIEKGSAYIVNGDVYYNVHKFESYGRLSNKKLEELESGFRIEVDERKKSAADFALWKSSKPGEQSWESPWGPGRPGWHIECSVMATSLLGDTIDIHGGGLDLVFPHHENEVAQSEACTGHKFVNYWMHNNMLEFGAQKMSKSLGNVRTGRAFIEEYNGEILKYFILSSHYRSIIDFSEEQVQRTIQSLAKFYSALAFAESLLTQEAHLVPIPEDFQKSIQDMQRRFERSMDEDFNTAEALSHLYELVKAFNNLVRKPKFVAEHRAAAEAFLALTKDKGNIMALFQEKPKVFLKTLDDMLLKRKGLKRSDIDALVEARTEARNSKNWSEADRLRSELQEKGILVQDSTEGSTWEVDKSLDN
ncbi:MAG: cysteine--tRNA ligase [Bdellovibrionaceae bacterium]|nr:cysteine--tRNA ligase [Pseudobdellovibrionaceae bacterium]